MAGGSFRDIMRGSSSRSMDSNPESNSTDSSRRSDDNDIVMQGWMRKQKETLRSWPRRFFTLAGRTMTYYESEDTSRTPRGSLEIHDVSKSTTDHNGLTLHLTNGKEVHVIADTHVAYAAWLTVLSSVCKQPQKKKAQTYKDGWAHCLTDDDVWTRYFVVINNDSFSCYEAEEEDREKEEDRELALSGLVRSVDEWDGKRYGLIASLNRSRTIKLCFDSAEEKMSWFLTLEFAVSYGSARMKRESSMKAAAKAKTVEAQTPTSTNEQEEDDGVWI